ncbi:MAG: hypothetical protein LBU11_07515 [Zoogloeaceae bacterium]|jgi:hypothetical protein|nr:hypothetical protein [Zoogloeaceae bacterium]
MNKKQAFLFLLTTLLFAPLALTGQASDAWFAFTEGEEDSALVGYKDAAGQVRIAPRFSPYMTSARKFDDIIAVAEEKENGEWNSYYLTKSGRRVGHGDMYVFDSGFDCESEGFIRFTQDGKTGMFDAAGNIAIPAEYNALSRAMNGMVHGLRNARKKYHGEHYAWEGGEGVLLTTNNKILIENFDFFDSDLDLYSLEISNQPGASPLRKNFLGVDGKNYAFVSFEREFLAWLDAALPEDFGKSDLLRVTHEKIAELTGEEAMQGFSKAQFVDAQHARIRARLALRKEEGNFISKECSIPELLEEAYFDNCRESKVWRYPVMCVVIAHHTADDDDYQDFFIFMRTGQGYELIDMRIVDQRTED